MLSFGYNNRWIRLVKDLLFVALSVWIITRASVWAILLGCLGLFWYGRDAYYQAKVLWQEKHFRPAQPQPKDGPTVSTPTDDGKITVTDLSDAKEVDYTKE